MQARDAVAEPLGHWEPSAIEALIQLRNVVDLQYAQHANLNSAEQYLSKLASAADRMELACQQYDCIREAQEWSMQLQQQGESVVGQRGLGMWWEHEEEGEMAALAAGDPRARAAGAAGGAGVLGARGAGAAGVLGARGAGAAGVPGARGAGAAGDPRARAAGAAGGAGVLGARGAGGAGILGARGAAAAAGVLGPGGAPAGDPRAQAAAPASRAERAIAGATASGASGAGTAATAAAAVGGGGSAAAAAAPGHAAGDDGCGTSANSNELSSLEMWDLFCDELHLIQAKLFCLAYARDIDNMKMQQHQMDHQQVRVGT